MITDYVDRLSSVIPERDSLKLVRQEALSFFQTHSLTECYEAIKPLYASSNFQIQEVGVFLCGHIGKDFPDAIQFQLGCCQPASQLEGAGSSCHGI